MPKACVASAVKQAPSQSCERVPPNSLLAAGLAMVAGTDTCKSSHMFSWKN